MDPASSLDPGSGWSVNEDNILISAYINDNVSFEELQKRLPGKTRAQCEARWTHYMQQTGNKGTWTRHEDQILHVCQKGYGNRWKSIKNFLPGRSENAVKNRWNAILRKTNPSPTDGLDSASGSPSDGGFYTGEDRGEDARLQSMSRQQLINDAAEARRKMHAQQAQLRHMQQQAAAAGGGGGGGGGAGGAGGANLSSSEMHLRLSPGAFGINSASPGPATGHAWGVNSSSTGNSFNFFPPSPAQTPQKRQQQQQLAGGPGGAAAGAGAGGGQQQRPGSGPGAGGRSSSGVPAFHSSGSNTPLALKVDTHAPYGYGYGNGADSAGGGLRRGGGADSKGSNKSLDESTSSMSREDMTELAEAFVAQEVEKLRKQTGETMSAEDQMLMRKAFVAGMQHSPPEKEMSAADLQWEFDQSGSIDAMISMDETDHSHFDGVVQGHAIFAHSVGAKSPDSNSRLSRSGMSIGASHGVGGLGVSGHHHHAHPHPHPHHHAHHAVGAGALSGGGGHVPRQQNSHAADMNLSVEGHSWGGAQSDLLNTDHLDEMSMSLLNMSLEESQDPHGGGGPHGHGGGGHGGPPGGGAGGTHFHP